MPVLLLQRGVASRAVETVGFYHPGRGGWLGHVVAAVYTGAGWWGSGYGGGGGHTAAHASVVVVGWGRSSDDRHVPVYPERQCSLVGLLNRLSLKLYRQQVLPNVRVRTQVIRGLALRVSDPYVDPYFDEVFAGFEASSAGGVVEGGVAVGVEGLGGYSLAQAVLDDAEEVLGGGYVDGLGGEVGLEDCCYVDFTVLEHC